MKLYIANKTCSQAIQVIANELGLAPELVHFDVRSRQTSNGEDFAMVNPLQYVPVLDLGGGDRLTETIVIAAYLADLHPRSGLAPPPGTLARARFDQLLVFVATEIAQKHIPLMRKLLTEEGAAWTRNKLVGAYSVLDERLARYPFVAGDHFTVVDAYVWATLWHERSGAPIGHLENLFAWKARVDGRPSVLRALADEAVFLLQPPTLET